MTDGNVFSKTGQPNSEEHVTFLARLFRGKGDFSKVKKHDPQFLSPAPVLHASATERFLQQKHGNMNHATPTMRRNGAFHIRPSDCFISRPS